MNRKEQLAVVKQVVEDAILQAAEISGLRNWIMRGWFESLKVGEHPDEEGILRYEVTSLLPVFEGIIDPNDETFFNSRWYTDQQLKNIVQKMKVVK